MKFFKALIVHLVARFRSEPLRRATLCIDGGEYSVYARPGTTAAWVSDGKVVDQVTVE